MRLCECVFWVFAYSRVEERYMSFFNYFPVIYDACFGSRSPVPKISWTPGMGNNIVHYYPAYIYTYMYTFPNIGPGIIPFNISDPINMWDIFVG